MVNDMETEIDRLKRELSEAIKQRDSCASDADKAEQKLLITESKLTQYRKVAEELANFPCPMCNCNYPSNASLGETLQDHEQRCRITRWKQALTHYNTLKGESDK